MEIFKGLLFVWTIGEILANGVKYYQDDELIYKICLNIWCIAFIMQIYLW